MFDSNNPTSPDLTANVPPEISLIKAQVMQLQTEMRDKRERTIPAIVEDIKTVNSEVRDTNFKLNARFDKLDCFMERMMSFPFFSNIPR